MTALTPEVAPLWRTAGTRVADAGLPPDLPNRQEMTVVAGALAAAQAQAYAAEVDRHQVLGFELLTGGSLEAWGQLSRTELQTVELVVAQNWRRIASEVGRLRSVELGEAA